MGGALQGLAVRQVECGLNLTVALTADGRIWQMGETGAPGHKLAPWEGAREAVQVITALLEMLVTIWMLSSLCSSFLHGLPMTFLWRIWPTVLVVLEQQNCAFGCC